MPRTVGASIPKYRKHRASGQAIVTIGGKDYYLGPHGTKASRIEYDRLISEWIANGRQSRLAPEIGLTIAELIKRYRQHALTHYVKNGQPTSEQYDIGLAVRPLRELYGSMSVNEFGPLALKAVREKHIQHGLVRTSINQHIHRIRRMFRWGVENELVAPSILQALEAVNGLCKGKTEARESEPVGPVSEATIEATLRYLPPVVADMVKFQRLTGARPHEVCMVRPGDVDTSGDVWTYVPAEHKTEHHGKQRTILIGPRAQDILRAYLLRPDDSYCFSPTESERKRRTIQHESRKTPLHYGNRPGSNRIRRKPRRQAGDRYDVHSYRRAIHRACDKAFPPPDDATDKERAEWKSNHRWSPNRLRHSAATEIRKRFGLEAAQVVLGHSMADVTQIYAERDMEKAAAVIREVG